MACKQVYSPGMFLVPQVGGHFFLPEHSTLMLIFHQVARSCYTLRGQNLERFNHRGLGIEVHGLLCLIFAFFQRLIHIPLRFQTTTQVNLNSNPVHNDTPSLRYLSMIVR